MSYCANCGKFLDDTIAVCPSCGTANSEYVPAPVQPEPAQAYAPQAPVQPAQPYTPVQPAPAQPYAPVQPAPAYNADPYAQPSGTLASKSTSTGSSSEGDRKKINVMAIVAACLFWIPVAGIVLNAIALGKANSGKFKVSLKPLAIVFLVLSILWTVYFIVMIVWVCLLVSFAGQAYGLDYEQIMDSIRSYYN